jgi:hypothetical protein
MRVEDFFLGEELAGCNNAGVDTTVCEQKYSAQNP